MSADLKSKLACTAAQLRRVCRPEEVSGATSTTTTTDVIGQTEALEAIKLGLEITGGDYADAHYNIMVIGSANTGRTAKTVEYVRAFMANIEAPPPDTICLHNFTSPRRPCLISVPNGRGKIIKDALAEFHGFIKSSLPHVLAMLRKYATDEINRERDRLIAELGQKVQAFGFLLEEGQEGKHDLCPMSMIKPGYPMPQGEYDALEEDIKEILLGENLSAAQKLLDEAKVNIGKVAKKAAIDLKKDELKLLKIALDKKFNGLAAIAPDNKAYTTYLAGLRQAAQKAVMAPKPSDGGGGGLAALLGAQAGGSDDGDNMKQFTAVNLMVDNTGRQNPPVVHAEMPQYSKLFGRINFQPTSNHSVMIDHSMLDSGKYLEANGGVLILDFNKLLSFGGTIALYKLLQVIDTKRLVIEGKAKFVDAESLVDYFSEEIPVNVRVIAICDQHLARVLQHHVPDFANLFRITAEFSGVMNIDDAPAVYAAFVEICRNNGGLLPFSPMAIARLVEYGSRRVDHQKQASAELGNLKDVITEASHWAKKAGASEVDVQYVEQAIKERMRRRDLSIRHYQRYWDDGVMLLDHDGAKVGQINGLVVMTISDEVKFGLPKRITARAFLGSEKVVLVQREADISGPSTNTATAIIRGYLSGQYGRKKKLALAAQICFEQTYGGVDGDSATLAELIAVISAITELPIDQRMAITGSMNQWGEAQPIGGVNWKIEGHFGALKRRGALTPGHGVVVPIQNVADLMFDEEVVQAQREGRYQVYAVRHIDEALELFLGRPAEEIHRLAGEALTKMGAKSGGLKEFFRRVFGRKQTKDPPAK